MNEIISNINYYLNISERLRSEVYSNDLSYYQKSVLEKYKLGELILIKTLGLLGNNVCGYELPVVYKIDDHFFNWYRTIDKFKNVNKKLFQDILIAQGWNVTCYEIDNEDIINSCEHDDDGIVCFYAEEIFDELAPHLSYLMENIYEVATEKGYSVYRYYQIINKRIGQYLSKKQNIHTEITIAFEHCLNNLSTLFSDSYCVESALIDNNLFMMGYFFYDDNINGNGVNEENYNMSFLIICCLINMLLDEIEK